eukprot:COSAG02_NODE_2_length_75708_cov_87.013953_59_plen_149_part_00
MTRYASPARSDLFLANCHAPPQESDVEIEDDEGEDENEDEDEDKQVDDYSKMKLKELKELCKEKRLPVKGKKDELIARLQEHSEVRSFLLFCPPLLYFAAESELVQDTVDNDEKEEEEEETPPPAPKKDKKKRKSGDDGKKNKKKKQK